MPKKDDTFASLAADLGSPAIVARIDGRIEKTHQELLDLFDLRKMAARRHRDASPAPKLSLPQNDESAAYSPAQKMANSGSDVTVTNLIAAYRIHPESPYQKLRHASRRNYDSILGIIERDIGELLVSDLDALRVESLYEEWKDGGQRVPMAGSLVGRLRSMATFGGKVMGSKECQQLRFIISEMKLELPKPRDERLTLDQAKLIISEAHKRGWHSLALAQAFQTDCKLRQRDVIGEWIPKGSEPDAEPKAFSGDEEWVRGLCWEQIDNGGVLRHIRSQTGKPVEKDLAEAELVQAEFKRIGGPSSQGPVIVSENHQRPYRGHEFRYLWRKCANAAGLPKSVWNMDTRD